MGRRLSLGTWHLGFTGVAILTRARVVLTDAVVYSDNSSAHIVRLDFSRESMPISVVCVYAPSSSGKRVNFYANQLLPALPVDPHVVVGRE